MATITKETYQEHELIPNIEYCLEQALQDISEVPDYSLEIPGMSGIKYRHFINNLLRSLETPRYLELGTWKGSTLCAAIGGIDNVVAVCADNYEYGGATIEEVNSNVDRVKTETASVTILNQQFVDFDYSAHGQFDVYLYDAGHTEEEHFQAIARCEPALADTAIIIIDDWNNHGGVESHIKQGTYRGFNATNLEVLYKFEVETGVNPPFPSEWHNGYGVFLVRKRT
jgi:predicted O-methyltransferase YrrM